MPLRTNLNFNPYFDDFDPDDKFYRVLFKPAHPVQARELNNVQSMLQNQIEQFGNHFFKEGSKVIPGNVSYNNRYTAVQIESQFNGVDVETYLDQLDEIKIKGATSTVEAEVVDFLFAESSERGVTTLYVKMEDDGDDDEGNNQSFKDGENLILAESSIEYAGNVIPVGSPFAKLIANNAVAQGSAVEIQDGIYFLRGHFCDIDEQSIVLEQYSNDGSHRVGLFVEEEIVTAYDDESLLDNAQGFNNYAAPGADRLRIEATLGRKDIDDFDDANFVEIMRIKDGEVQEFQAANPMYKHIRDEMARRTYEESGNYYVKPFTLEVEESLNDFKGNDGVFKPTEETDEGATPSDELMVYEIGAGKAYVKGYEIEKLSTSNVDVNKPRDTSTVELEQVTIDVGPVVRVHNVFGAPVVGFGTTITLQFRDALVGSVSTTASGNVIGEARVYDFHLLDGIHEDQTTQYSLRLFDIDNYAKITFDGEIDELGLSDGTHIEGETSGAGGFVVGPVGTGFTVTIRAAEGTFKQGETIEINGDDNAISVAQFESYDINKAKSVFQGSSVGINTFNADLVLGAQKVFLNEEYTVSAADSISGIATITSTTPIGLTTAGTLLSFKLEGNTESTLTTVVGTSKSEAGVYKVEITGVTTVRKLFQGGLPPIPTKVTQLIAPRAKYEPKDENTLYEILHKSPADNVQLNGSDIFVRKFYSAVSVSANQASLPTAETDFFFQPFQPDRYLLSYSDGTIEPLSRGNVSISTDGKSVALVGLSKTEDTNAIAYATQKKFNIKAKKKIFNPVNILTINRSTNPASGIGSTTLNDGLIYDSNYAYGTRVQDDRICLLKPDVVDIWSVIESNDADDPDLPKVEFDTLNGPNSDTSDLLVGEELFGETSEEVALVVRIDDANNIRVVMLSDGELRDGEQVRASKSGVRGLCKDFTKGAKDIKDQYKLNQGRKRDFMNYGVLERVETKTDGSIPTAGQAQKGLAIPDNRLTIIYSTFDLEEGDTGELITVESYAQEFYGDKVGFTQDVRQCDIIDYRPRVGAYDLSSTLSPLDQKSRNFAVAGLSAPNILVSDEQITITYDYYLSRIDRLYLTPEGEFQVVKGQSAEDPELPEELDGGAMEVASIGLPAYLFDVDDATITLSEHKRYTMKDIADLERRIKALEYYYKLLMEEQEAMNLKITTLIKADKDDPSGGAEIAPAPVERPKAGVIVDTFQDFLTADQEDPEFKSSLDKEEGECRPKHFTRMLPLQLSQDGIITDEDDDDSTRDKDDIQVVDFDDSDEGETPDGLRRTGDVLTLDYEEIEYLSNPFASRTVRINPFRITYWFGKLQVWPRTDNWVSTKRFKVRNAELYGDFRALRLSVGRGAQIGYNEIVWGAWLDEVIGRRQRFARRVRAIGGRKGYRRTIPKWWNDKKGNVGRIARAAVRRARAAAHVKVGIAAFRARKALRGAINKNLGGIEEKYLASGTGTRFIRSRNFRLRGTRMRPRARVWCYINDKQMTGFTTPKLVRIRMKRGVFRIGERVIGYMPRRRWRWGWPRRNAKIVFRVAHPRHRYGNIRTGQTRAWRRNPALRGTKYKLGLSYRRTGYGRNRIISKDYTASSRFINVDLATLSSSRNPRYYGYIAPGMVLKGQTSGAIARVVNRVLKVRRGGVIDLSVFIPNPRWKPRKFKSGLVEFRLSASRVNRWRVRPRTEAAALVLCDGKVDKVTPVYTGLHPVYRYQSRWLNKVFVGKHRAEYRIARNQLRRQINLLTGNAANPNTFGVAGRGQRAAVRNRVLAARALRTAGTILYRSAVRAERRRVAIGRRIIKQGYFRDPLAQTFTVDETPGIFVTKFDLYFQRKDNRFSVTAELRTCENGIPTDNVIPGSRVEIPPDDIRRSRYARNKTEVDFEEPIYLEGGKEYALVLDTDSRRYRVWISRVGEIDITIRDDEVLRDNRGRSVFVRTAGYVDYTRLTAQERRRLSASRAAAIQERGEFVDRLRNVRNLPGPGGIVARVVTDAGRRDLARGAEFRVRGRLVETSRGLRLRLEKRGTGRRRRVYLRAVRRVNRRKIAQQPLSGALFRSQAAGAWTPSLLEDLKWTLYRARFDTSNPRTATFYNTPLNRGNRGIVSLDDNPIRTLPQAGKVVLSEKLSDAEALLLKRGTVIRQNANPNFRAVIARSEGGVALGTTSITIIKAGIGFTPSSGIETYVGVALTTLNAWGIRHRQGTGLLADVTVTNGAITQINVTDGGSDWQLNERVGIASIGSIGDGQLGRDFLARVSGVSSNVVLRVTDVYGVPNTGATGSASSLSYRDGDGVLQFLPSGIGISAYNKYSYHGGETIRVYARGHGMYDRDNRVRLRGIEPDSRPRKITYEVDSVGNDDITVTGSMNIFTTFERVGVSTTNPGYVIIDDEVIEYTGVDGQKLVGITARGVDFTRRAYHDEGSEIQKYELDGISLRRINTEHDLIPNLITGENRNFRSDHNFFDIDIDLTQKGIDRSADGSFPRLTFRKGKRCGGDEGILTQNWTYSAVTPHFHQLVFPNTKISGRLRSITATSIDGNENSFQDADYEPIEWGVINELKTERMVASRLNEVRQLDSTTFPGKRSFTMDVTLESADDKISPVIDLDRAAVILTDNIINRPYSNNSYMNNKRILRGKGTDDHEFIYVTKVLDLPTSATALQVRLEAYFPPGADIRCAYNIVSPGAEDNGMWTMFPGYLNIDSKGLIIDEARNDGRPDQRVPRSEKDEFQTFKFSVDNQAPFQQFKIKIMCAARNQADPPRLTGLKVIALV